MASRIYDTWEYPQDDPTGQLYLEVTAALGLKRKECGFLLSRPSQWRLTQGPLVLEPPHSGRGVAF